MNKAATRQRRQSGTKRESECPSCTLLNVLQEEAALRPVEIDKLQVALANRGSKAPSHKALEMFAEEVAEARFLHSKLQAALCGEFSLSVDQDDELCFRISPKGEARLRELRASVTAAE
jgi:hypothetical protein